MDEKGYWHNRPPSQLEQQMERSRENQEPRERFVISFEIGSTVLVTRGDDKLICVFEGAAKNKVTLRPVDEVSKPRPYLELAERVELSDGTNPVVAAQVWDNRHGKIVLRTLPI